MLCTAALTFRPISHRQPPSPPACKATAGQADVLERLPMPRWATAERAAFPGTDQRKEGQCKETKTTKRFFEIQLVTNLRFLHYLL